MGCGGSRATVTTNLKISSSEPVSLKEQVSKKTEHKLWKQTSLETRLLQPTGKNISPFLFQRSPGESKGFKVGDRVHLRGYVGTIKFIGSTELGHGDWIGIEMDKEIEQGHNGSYDGIQYFIAGPRRGVFSRSALVFHLDETDERNIEQSIAISPRTIVLIQTRIRRYLKYIHNKKTILNTDVEKRIDRHVQSVPDTETCSIKSLSHFLAEPFDGGQRSKAFAIYRWITLNIQFDYKGCFGYDTPMSSSADEVLGNRIAGPEGFANLFAALCNEANVPTRTVRGIFKGYGYSIGESVLEEHSRHAWNVVRVSGDWFICDCTLGAGYFGDDLMFHRLPNVDRFMVPAGLAITDHYPDEEKWQLLDVPVSKEEFEMKAVPSAAMNRLNIQLGSHSDCFYDIEYDNIVMTFQTPKKNILKGVVKDANGKSLGQRSLVQSVSLGGKTKIQAYFPEPGEYRLVILVLGTNYEWTTGVVYRIRTSDGIGYNTGGFPSIGTKFYMLGFAIEKPTQNIECDDGRAVLYFSTTNSKVKTLRPKLSRLSLVSDNEELREDVQDTSLCYVDHAGVVFKVKVHVPQMGIYKLDIYCELRRQTEYLCSYFINAYHGATPIAGFPRITDMFRVWSLQLGDKRENIESQDGTTSVTLRNPNQINLFGVLKKNEEECDGMCSVESTEKGDTLIHVHAPEPGIFRLEIYGYKENKDQTRLLCSYAIKSLEAANENPGFPTLEDAIDAWGVSLLDPVENITSKNGQASVVLEAPDEIDVVGKLFDDEDKEVPGMCIAKETENGREISMNTPRPGMYKLCVYGRKRTSKKSKKEPKKVLLCSYKVKSYSAASENPGFPELTDTFNSWNLKLVDQFDNISTETGRSTVTIQTPGSVFLSAKLRQNEHDLPHDLCFTERNGGDTKISFHVPEAGLYELRISGRESPDSKSKFLGSYSVFSCRGLGERAGFPRVEDEFRLWGLRLDSNKENISVYDGSVVITFLNPNKIILSAELLNEEGEVTDVVPLDEMDERVLYKCELPSKGKYTFKLSGSNKVEGRKKKKKDKKKLLCTYKIFY